MYIQGNPKIAIVQGDSYTREIEFEGIDLDLIDKIFFASIELSICKVLEKDDNLFRIHLSSDETMKLETGTFDFDLTIKFVDDQYRTIQYRSIITVLEKVNKVICNE